MPGARLDLQRLVAADGHPRQARGAEVVEGHVLPCGVVGEELGPPDVGRLQGCSELRGQGLHARHPGDHRAGRVALGTEHAEQGEERRLDREPSRLVALRRLHAAPRAVDPSVDVDDGPFHVDVFPVERLELGGAGIEVDRQGEETAPAQGDGFACEQRLDLARVEVDLGLLGASVGPADACRRVVRADAQGARFRTLRVAEELGNRPPDMAPGQPCQLSRAHLAIQGFHDALDVGAGDFGDRLVPDQRKHVGSKPRAVIPHAAETPFIALSEPSFDVGAHRLPRRRAAFLGAIENAVPKPGGFGQGPGSIARPRLREAGREADPRAGAIVKGETGIPVIAVAGDGSGP